MTRQIDGRLRLSLLLGCALALPSPAWAASCPEELQDVAEDVSRLPGNIPYQVPDQLREMYDEASELVETDPAACFAIVKRMRALVVRYGSGVGAEPVVAGGQGGGPAPGARLVDDEEHIDDAERLRGRIERASADQGEELQAVGDYRDAARQYGQAIRAFAVARGPTPPEVAEVESAVATIETVTREMEEIVIINAPDDVMHARLEDAVRRVEEARRALERAWQRYHAREVAKAQDYIAPLTSPGFEPAPLVNDFIAPLGDAETRAAQARLRQAERELKQVRNNYDPHVHRTDWKFLDMKAGYKEAYKAEHDSFAKELKAFEATLDSYMPDRVAAYTRKREALVKAHEKRLDEIFERYAIR